MAAGAVLQHRKGLKPVVHTGFVSYFYSDKNDASSLQTIWKNYECRRRRVIT